MNRRHLDIIVITDIHHTGKGDLVIPSEEEKRGFRDAPLFVSKVLARIDRIGIKADLLILLGDLVNDGNSADAVSNLEALSSVLRKSGIPFLVVAGNHDANPADIEKIFGCGSGLHEIGGYGFVIFNDKYEVGDKTRRSVEGLRSVDEIASSRPGLPLITLQHNPIYPDIIDDYPYMPINTKDIIAGYEKAGVILSLSGHYHAGQKPCSQNNVLYYTAPCACEMPYRFAHIELDDKDVRINELSLRLDVGGLLDSHCHTEFAYCAEDVTTGKNIALAKMLGVGGVCFVEHTFQLYQAKESAWNWQWQVNDEIADEALKGRYGRIDEYRAHAGKWRSEYVRFGLEVDLRHDGRMFVADDDLAGWDVLIGAIHALSGGEKVKSQKDAERLFMKHMESFMKHPVNIIAHPFRYFQWSRLEMPVHLFEPVAKMLADHQKAAEINSHKTTSDPRFIEMCLSNGVKLSLATDSHSLFEVGDLTYQIGLLREVGVRDEDFASVLYRF